MPLEFREVMELVTHDWNADRDNRDDALEDLHFIAGDQWHDAAKKAREAEQRPVLTVNRMGSFVRQVSGDLRQSAPSIDPVPVDGGTDEQMTEIFAGLIRQIEYQSGAGAAYSHGAEMAIACGIGHWRVLTEFVEDSVFDQEIRIKRVLDPLSVIWDANAVELDRRDAKHCFITEVISQDSFRKRFPDATVSDFTGGVSDDRSGLYWHNQDTVRIAEYWRLEPVKRLLGLTQDGETINLTKFKEAGQINPEALQFMGIQRTREVDTHKVVHQMISGSDFLTERKDWAGRHIPIVPIIGNELPINGEVIRHGLIRWAKDPQRLYNYWRSAAAETIASSPKAPYTGTVDMFEGLEDIWANANTTTSAFLPYNKDPEAPGLRPQREQPPTPPAAMWTEAQVAQDDMKATTGIFDASLGAQGNETSGRAIVARQREGDTGSFVYFDNFNHAIRRTGEILVDLIPKIYDADRTVRIIGKDERESFAQINREVQTVSGERVIINDISTARFDVRIKTGPSYMTAKTEAREQLTQMVQANPNLWSIIGDLIVETMDFPGADKIAERLKKAMDPAIVGEEDDEPQQPDPIEEALQRLQLEGVQLGVEQQAAEVDKTVAETEKIEAETIGKVADAQVKRDQTDLKAFEMGFNTI